MKKKLEDAARAIGSQPEIAEKLEQLLDCPKDRAYIICSYVDCAHNVKQECTIFTLLDSEARTDGKPCSSYVRNN